VDTAFSPKTRKIPGVQSRRLSVNRTAVILLGSWSLRQTRGGSPRNLQPRYNIAPTTFIDVATSRIKDREIGRFNMVL
jgi:hypothetical protein